MILLQCVNLTKSFGAETLLDNIKLEVKSGERVALVGRNGAGKSTLLKIISGQTSYDSGEIITPKGIRMGYLAQHTGLESQRSIWDEMLSIYTEVIQMEKQIRRLEEKMANPAVYENNAQYEKILKEYDELQVEFKERGGYQYEADIRSILSGLNFASFDYSTPISSLSGGQKTRLALGKLLLSKPELLILDEPTNHLDIETLTWLEQYLTGYKGAILIVSHDRYFLDKIVHKVYEVAWKEVTLFQGNYSFYLDEKAKRYELEQKAFEKNQEERARLVDFVQRNLARASTSKRAQSKRKQLEKMESLSRPLGDEKSAKFSFDIDRQSGNEVVKVNNLTVSYDGSKPLFTNLNLQLNRKESVALIGPNGVGKTTLLKAIIDKVKPSDGTISFGSKVTVGYYDQEQTQLTSNKTVLQELWDEYPLTNEKDIRTVLGNFLFSGDDVLKHVSELSGGEKARLALAKLMMKKANFLIFDEPTNHLDLDSKEVLESALLDYPGTLLFVSHDRYFLNRMSTRIVEMTSEGLKDYLGDYDYYLMKKEEERQREELRSQREASSSSQEEQNGSDKESYFLDKEAKKRARKRKRDIETIEKEIEDLEQEIEEMENKLLDPEIYESHQKAQELQEKIDTSRLKAEELMEKWEELQLEEDQ
ncbi:ABC-F family ATP-binding cassette domain-containing protein [Thalassorhabdus alkalitolerans]|uniref:ABC-F family ATP-binding cassette domain-containing protein n=1 Tax=Thalassorhabdus alkalitolerans TaxID=2282697 RepID=A0ABW0YR07_9BACI